MAMQFELGDITVHVVLKDIKNVHLSVYPPTGAVRMAAPARMDLDTLRVYAISKLGWIKKQQEKLRGQARQTPREYVDRESHWFWGKRYLLKVQEHDGPPGVDVKHQTLVLRVRPGADEDKKQEVVDEWYRQQLKEAVRPLVATWEQRLGVTLDQFTVRKMKTRWGTCNPTTRSMLINLELAKKPPICLEYIVVHELVHLLERSHNARFVALMDQYMPGWRGHREELNRLPVRNESWGY